MKINLLLLIDSLNIGGAEYVVKELALALKKDGSYNPIVCCLTVAGSFANELRKKKIKVIELNKREGKFLDIKLFKRLVNCIKDNNIGLIHSHLFCSNFYGRIVSFLMRKPIVITEHSLSPKKLNSFINWILSYFTNKIVCVSRAVKLSFIKKGINENKLCVIYNGINLDSFEDYKHKFNSKKINLGFVGRLVYEKKILSLIKLMPKLDKKFKNLKLSIVGDGPLKEEILNYIQNLNLSSVELIGIKENKEIPKILKKFDLMILPSNREGFPISLLEAMASKIPVIATGVGGVPEVVVNNKTGIIIQDNESLFEAISILLNDRKLMKEMGLEGRKRVKEQFHIRKVVREHISLYESFK